jgi:ribosomal protein L37AE/L43A
MKISDVSVGQTVEVQFIPDGPWFPAVVMGIAPAGRFRVTIKGLKVAGRESFYSTCTIGAKYLRPLDLDAARDATNPIMHDLECALCGKQAYRNASVAGVYVCESCGAIWGRCYLGESYKLVANRMVTTDPPRETWRYYDLTCLGSDGITRRHGWFEAGTGNIIQVG